MPDTYKWYLAGINDGLRCNWNFVRSEFDITRFTCTYYTWKKYGKGGSKNENEKKTSIDNLLDMTTFVVYFNGAKKLDNLVGAGTSIRDEVYKNREQLYWQ